MAMTAFEVFGVLKLNTEEFNKGLKKAENSAGSFSKAGSLIGSGLATAAKVGMAAVTAATGAVTAFAGSAVAVGSRFDQAMGGVAATLGQTVDELDAQVGAVDTSFGHFEGTLRDFAMYMGQNTVFSASQAASALNYMALAGYNTQESMEMLPSVLDMAAAGGMDLAKASDMITDTQRALGLSFERTNQMVDEFAKAASTGNTNVEQLGEAFLRVGGLAAELNGGVVKLADGTTKATDGTQELEIAFTAMANAGVKGAEAGTHMRNMLLKLSSPTKDGAAALEEMGVAIFDAQGNMRALSDIFGDLNGALSQMTQEGRISVISDLFNTRDLASAEALLSAVGQDWDKIGESILDAEGAASKMSETKLDNLTGDLTLFNSALETAQITINDQLSPYMRQFVQIGTTGLQELTTGFQEGGLTGAMEAFGSTLSVMLNKIIEYLPTMIDAGGQLLGALGQGLVDNIDVITQSGIQIVNKLLMSMVEATSGENTAAGTVMNSILQAFVQNAPTMLYAGFQIIQNIANGISQNIPQLVSYATELIVKFGEFLVRNLPSLVSAAAEMISNLANGIAESLPELIPVAIDTVLAFVDAIVNNLDTVLDAALNLIVALANGLIENLPKLIERLPEIITKLADTLITLAPQLIVAAAELMLQIQLGLIENLPVLVKAVPEIIAGLISAFIDGGAQMLESGKELIEKVKEGFLSLDPIQWGKDLIDNFVKGMTNAAGTVGKAVSSVAGTIKSFLHFSEPDKGPLSNFSTYAPDMMNLFAKGITDSSNMLVNTITNVLTNFLSAFTSLISKLPTIAETYATQMATKFINAVKQLPDNIQRVFDDVINKLKNFGTKFIAEGPKIAEDFFKNFIDVLNNVGDKMSDVGRNIVEGLKSGISKSWTALTDWIKSLATKLVETFKKNLKIESPSRVFADEIGKWIPAGIAMGIEQNSGMLYRSIDDLTSNIASVDNPVKASVDNLSNILGKASENQQIVVNVTLQGDADRLFRVIQAKATSNYTLTGRRDLVTV